MEKFYKKLVILTIILIYFISLSTNSIFKNINTYDNNGFRQRYWVINDDVDVSTITKQTKTSESSEKYEINDNSTDEKTDHSYNEIKNLNFKYHFDLNDNYFNKNLNFNTLNNEVVYNNYINTFCSEFFENKCNLCIQIHKIGQKYGIECQCPFCYYNEANIVNKNGCLSFDCTQDINK